LKDTKRPPPIESWVKVNLGMACNKIRMYKDANGKIYGYAIGVDVMKYEF
jgi:hypothetical protein